MRLVLARTLAAVCGACLLLLLAPVTAAGLVVLAVGVAQAIAAL